MTLNQVEQMTSKQLLLVKIPSGEDYIVGRLFIAEGEQAKPTILLLHGFPGTILNLDIASDLQEQGYQVLVINYRGSWGSQGSFSFANSLADVQAALRFLKQEDIATANRIDVDRIAVVGYSFGGFLALKTAAIDSSIKVVASLSGANFAQYVKMIEKNPKIELVVESMLEEGCFFLNNCSAQSILTEVRVHEQEWNVLNFVSYLKGKKLLLTAAVYDEEVPKVFFHDPIEKALEESDVVFDNVLFETDHGYNNKRKELSATLQDWLSKNL